MCEYSQPSEYSKPRRVDANLTLSSIEESKYKAYTLTVNNSQPTVLDIVHDLGKPATDGYIVNDSTNDLLISINDGDTFILKKNEVFDFTDGIIIFKVNKISIQGTVQSQKCRVFVI